MLLYVLDSELCRSSQTCADPRDASVPRVKGTLLFPKCLRQMMFSVSLEWKQSKTSRFQTQGIWHLYRFFISHKGFLSWALMGLACSIYLRHDCHACRSGFTQPDQRAVRRISSCAIFTGSSNTWLIRSLIILSSPTHWCKPQGERRTQWHLQAMNGSFGGC